MAQQILPSNTFTTAKWIVSANASDGTHTTIAAALTSASSGDTIFIRPGTYTENLTLKAGVNLAAYSCDGMVSGSNSPNVIILGKMTATFAGTCSISGIQLKTNADNFLAISGSNATCLFLINCFLDCNNATGINYSSSSGSANLMIFSCRGDIDAIGNAYFVNTSSGKFKISNSVFFNNASSTTASSVAVNGGLDIVNTQFINDITYASGSSANIGNSQIGNFTTSGVGTFSFDNVAMSILTTAGTGSGSIRNSSIFGGSSSAVSVGVGTTVTLSNCVVNSSNTNAITGAGTIKIGAIIFSGTSSTVNTTTQTALPIGFAPAGSAGTPTSNALSTYEEGTWTPTLLFGGGSTGITYTTQVGQYVKIGKAVTISGIIVLSNKGSSTGVATVSGLPFTSSALTGNQQNISLTTKGSITYTSVAQLSGVLTGSSTSINFDAISTTGVQSQLSDTSFTNVSAFLIQGTYISN